MGLRGPKCGVCNHREAAQIDLALARRVSVTAISKRFGVSVAALYRHQKAHLTPITRAALLAGPDTEIDLEQLRSTESQSWLASLIAIRHRLFASLDIAEECSDVVQTTRVINQLHRNLELSGQYLGDLSHGSTSVTNNILIQPAWMEVRVALVQALSDYPEARKAVAQVLHTFEEKAAEEVKPKEFASC